MIDTLHIPVLRNVMKTGIGHPKLLALVNIGRAPHTMDHCGRAFFADSFQYSFVLPNLDTTLGWS